MGSPLWGPPRQAYLLRTSYTNWWAGGPCMVVCYGSAARPINQAASWLLEVLHAKEPEVGHNANVNQEARLGQTTPFPFLWLPSQTAPTPLSRRARLALMWSWTRRISLRTGPGCRSTARRGLLLGVLGLCAPRFGVSSPPGDSLSAGSALAWLAEPSSLLESPQSTSSSGC